jgi:ribosomal protein S18 acetylase RimI-like enzyme
MRTMSFSPSQEGTMTTTSTATYPRYAGFRAPPPLPATEPTIREATRADQDRFQAAMTLAFSADPAARWAWPDPLQFIDVFVPLVTLFGGKSFDHGTAYVIGDFSGVAQWLPPGVLPDDEPIASLFERYMIEPQLGDVLSLFEQMGAYHPDEPHWYLPLIGVDPMFQGRGYGTQLIQKGLAACDRNHEIAYLEATSPVNRSLYERLGFRVLGEIRSGDSPPMFPMLREPR